MMLKMNVVKLIGMIIISPVLIYFFYVGFAYVILHKTTSPNVYHYLHRNFKLFPLSGKYKAKGVTNGIAELLLNINQSAKSCEQLMKLKKDKIDQDLQVYTKSLQQHDVEFKKYMRPHDLEGYAAQVQAEIAVQLYLATLPFVKTVCETGFNGGHSTLLWLLAKNDIHVYSFDIGSHSYSKPMAQRLANLFPSRFTITWGDSTKTLPDFRKQNPTVKCDLIIIDGGHSYGVAQADYNSFKQMANKVNIVFMDDHPCVNYWCKGPGKAWQEGISSKSLKELAKCSTKDKGRGFAFGCYML